MFQLLNPSSHKHFNKICRYPNCAVADCGRRHHKLLHGQFRWLHPTTNRTVGYSILHPVPNQYLFYGRYKTRVGPYPQEMMGPLTRGNSFVLIITHAQWYWIWWTLVCERGIRGHLCVISYRSLKTNKKPNGRWIFTSIFVKQYGNTIEEPLNCKQRE